MTILAAIALGILQGLTEFFPVSSSGHLALFSHWFGVDEPDLTFDILVHLATLGAIVVYFREDWKLLFRMLLRGDRGDLPKHIVWFTLISMIPAGIVGVFFTDAIAWVHMRPELVGGLLLVTGTTLLFGFQTREGERPLVELTLGIVIAMAFAQALAVLPGISRAGMTIMMAIFLGMQRRAAARFSFFMAVPIIAGAGVLALKDLFEAAPQMASDQLMAYGAGFVAAMLSGFFALAFLMKLLEGRRFFYFAFYCFAMGTVAILSGLS